MTACGQALPGREKAVDGGENTTTAAQAAAAGATAIVAGSAIFSAKDYAVAIAAIRANATAAAAEA
jgi:ribulose-phosphate 3-epimerase